MQAPGGGKASSGALQDLTGPDLNVQRSPRSKDTKETTDEPLSKATAQDSAAAQEAQRRSGRTRTVRVRDGFFDSSLL